MEPNSTIFTKITFLQKFPVQQSTPRPDCDNTQENAPCGVRTGLLQYPPHPHPLLHPPPGGPTDYRLDHSPAPPQASLALLISSLFNKRQRKARIQPREFFGPSLKFHVIFRGRAGRARVTREAGRSGRAGGPAVIRNDGRVKFL